MSLDQNLQLVALIGAALAFSVGLWQYRRSQQWKRAEWVAQEMKSFLDDPLVEATLQMIDWERRSILLFPRRDRFEDRFVTVTDALVTEALKPHEQASAGFTEAQAAVRDAFDRFLDGLERIEDYIATGLITNKDIRPYLDYWAKRIISERLGDDATDRFQQLQTYMRRYGYDGARRLLARLAKEATP